MTFPTSKSILQASFSKVGGAEFSSLRVCVCVGVGKPPPKTQPPPNVNWWVGRGRANETENAVLILISAHVEKEAKLPRQQMSKVSNERFLLSKKGRFVGRLGSGIFLWDQGAGNMICFRLSDLLILCTNFGATCPLGGCLALENAFKRFPLGDDPMVVVCVLLLYTHNNSSVTLCFSVNIIVVLFHYHT